MQIYCSDLTGMALSFATAKTLQWKCILMFSFNFNQ